MTSEEKLALRPADPRLAELYVHACKACHVVADSGAPQVGDSAAWDARFAAGEDALLANMIAGLRGMPPGGQCVACSPEDLLAIARFMAGRQEASR